MFRSNRVRAPYIRLADGRLVTLSATRGPASTHAGTHQTRCCVVRSSSDLDIVGEGAAQARAARGDTITGDAPAQATARS
ncbi:hypothetical protein [Pararobbsia silviterrae]|uniref:Uncharacterized protein n=1 Tax=Pararobbsia silviterrae TaxID=1792498 RepID=A0A494XVW9_9BURK|nr:hypothetical protein [Pararobbsia silviterrae]RKP54718.1 hypothetical protein D7S86_13820 [Pararobbsia silviterrae]